MLILCDKINEISFELRTETILMLTVKIINIKMFKMLLVIEYVDDYLFGCSRILIHFYQYYLSVLYFWSLESGKLN